MTWYQAILLFAAAVLGGTLNSVAGGGTFITLPTLIFTGVPSVNANVTSTVALWPGTLATIGGYRGTLHVERRLLLILGGVSIVGGALGALVLLHTTQTLFLHLVPYLLLLATLLFAFGGTITSRLRPRKNDADGQSGPFRLSLGWVVTLQFVIALYGGFFGGGIGILMLAALSAMGMDDIHSANALKAILNACINGVAIVTFIIAGAVFWGQAIVMILGAIAGGYGGARVARRLDPKLVRRFVILVGIVMSIYFFVRK
ncbi:MAG: sulfite exporter TauE/SafE family protein [Ktedonobacterales bacterium]